MTEMTPHKSLKTDRSAPGLVPVPKNRLLAKSRQWHKWAGLCAGIFLSLAGVSGIVLNYKQPVFNALGLENKPPKPAEPKNPPESAPALTTGADIATLSVGIRHAIERARSQWGNTPLERIELKSERGELLCKIKRKDGEELWLNAATGAHFIKGRYERIRLPGANGVPARQTDWGKILLDLHTGKIGGEIGKAVMSVAALLLLFLTASGVYLWAKPLLIRRRNARRRVPPAGPPKPASEFNPSYSPVREPAEV